MCEEFSKRLTAIRKDKKITQKQAANALGVSQALLSHYEKGIRECGLEFIIKACNYYGVSADYLLNLSAETKGTVLNEEDMADPANERGKGDLALILGKKVVFNGVDMVYDIAASVKDKDLTLAINEYFFLTTYRAFRALYDSNENNPKGFFLVDKQDSANLTDAALFKTLAQLNRACLNTADKAPALGQSAIEQNFSERASGILNLIKNAETKIRK